MRLRTAMAALLCCAALAGVAVAGVTAESGALTQTWVSDTARDNEVNHHSAAVGPHGEVLVAPVAAVPAEGRTLGPTACSLVRLRPSDGAIRWRWSVPGEDCFTHALTQPAIADVDADPGLEVAVGTTQDALVVLDAASGREEWRLPLSTYGYGQPAVGNVTGDARPEIVVSDIDGRVVAAHGNGTIAWQADANTTVWARPRLADVDGDSGPEVVVGGNDAVTAYDGDGSERWRTNVSAKALAVGDGTVFAGDLGRLVALSGETGERVWQREFRGTPRIYDAGDADGDGRTEVYATVSGTVVAIEADTGATDWATDLGGGERQSSFAPVLADVDGDGTEDVVAVTNDGTVVVLDPESGEERAAYERNVLIWTFVETADVDGDGDSEVFVTYGDGRVVALDWTENGFSVAG